MRGELLDVSTFGCSRCGIGSFPPKIWGTWGGVGFTEASPRFGGWLTLCNSRTNNTAWYELEIKQENVENQVVFYFYLLKNLTSVITFLNDERPFSQAPRDQLPYK